MTSDRFFSKSMKSDMKRDIPSLIIYCGLFFFLILVAYILHVQNALNSPVNTSMTGSILNASRQSAMLTSAVLSFGMQYNTLCLTILGFCEAYHQFGFLHRSRELDFVHAMPQKRKHIFAARYLNGFLLVMVPYTVFIGIGTAIALFGGVPAGSLIPAVLLALGLNALVFLVTYSMCILAVMLTGNAFTGISGMIVFLVYFPLLGLLIDSIPQSWFKTYVAGSGLGLKDILKWISPIGINQSWIEMYNAMRGDNSFIVKLTTPQLISIIAVAAVIIILTLLSLAVYKKRPLESAGEALSFRKGETPIRIALEVLGGIAFMQFFFDLHSTFGWGLFGMIIGILMVHLVVQLIYRKEVKGMLKNPVQLAVTLVIGGVFVCALAFDWIGYDSYIPDAADVEYAYVDGQFSQNSLWINVEQAGEGEYQWAQIDVTRFFEKSGEMDDEYKEAVLEIAKEGVANATMADRQAGLRAALYGYTYNDAYKNYGDGAEELQYITVYYKLKNDRIVKRAYAVSEDLLESTSEKIYASEEIKRLSNPVLNIGNSGIKKISYDENGANVSLSYDDELREELLNALKEDTENLTVSQMKAAYPVGILKLYIDEATYRKLTGQSMPSTSGAQYYIGCPVYAAFENTIRQMEKAGVKAGEAGDSLFDNSDIYYECWNTIQDDDYQTAYRDMSGVITDKNSIEILKKSFVADDLANYNMFGPETLGMSLSIYFTDKDTGKTISGTLIKNADSEALYQKCYETGDAI